MLTAVVCVILASAALAAYTYLFSGGSWLRPGSYVIFEQFFVWDGSSVVEYMTWNITAVFDGQIDLRLQSHGANFTRGQVELTIGEANLTINRVTREVTNGSDLALHYIGEKWPFWIEANATVGSAVETWYGLTTIRASEVIYALGKRRDCWVVEYSWPSASMRRWFDKSSGLLLKIHNVLHRQGVTIVVTETAVETNIAL
jgi:hypothetical protein